MRDLCSWCGEVQEIFAERESEEDGKLDRICRSCAEVIGLIQNTNGSETE